MTSWHVPWRMARLMGGGGGGMDRVIEPLGFESLKTTEANMYAYLRYARHKISAIKSNDWDQDKYELQR